MPSRGNLNDQGDALALLLEGIHTDAVVAARGEPECGLPILVRPTTGPQLTGASGDCYCEVRWTVLALRRLDCPLEDAQRVIYDLMSSCGDNSIPARLKPAPRTPTPLLSPGDPPTPLEAAITAVDPPTSFGVFQYKTDGPPNMYGAMVALTVRYKCC